GAVPCLNLAWTLMARGVRRAMHGSALLLAQELLDGLVVGFLAAELNGPIVLALLLVPVTAMRDDLGRGGAALVVLAGAGGLAPGSLAAAQWPDLPAQFTVMSVLLTAALVIWLKPPPPHVARSDRHIAKAAMLWQMAANLVSPLLNRAGLIRARADHIDLVLP